MTNLETTASPDRAELADLIRRFGERMRHRFMDVVEEFELTPPLFAAIKALDEPCPMRDVASHLSCDASYVTGLADRLESLGFVERRPDPSDRRVKQLALTERGRQVRDKVIAAMDRSHELLDELDDEEVAVMTRAYRKLLDSGR